MSPEQPEDDDLTTDYTHMMMQQESIIGHKDSCPL